MRLRTEALRRTGAAFRHAGVLIRVDSWAVFSGDLFNVFLKRDTRDPAEKSCHKVTKSHKIKMFFFVSSRLCGKKRDFGHVSRG